MAKHRRMAYISRHHTSRKRAANASQFWRTFWRRFHHARAAKVDRAIARAFGEEALT